MKTSSVLAKVVKSESSKFYHTKFLGSGLVIPFSLTYNILEKMSLVKMSKRLKLCTRCLKTIKTVETKHMRKTSISKIIESSILHAKAISHNS